MYFVITRPVVIPEGVTPGRIMACPVREDKQDESAALRAAAA